MEKAGIVLMLEFYNDATDLELRAWRLDSKGNLHPEEERFITGIVNRFNKRRNIHWSIEESADSCPRGCQRPRGSRSRAGV